MEIVSAILALVASFFGVGDLIGSVTSRPAPIAPTPPAISETVQRYLDENKNDRDEITDVDALPEQSTYMWSNYQKPDEKTLEETLDPLAFKVTQEEGTEPARTSPLDKNYEPGIYVDILSGEPLFSSRDKFDSGTGWPSFVKPIGAGVVKEEEDRRLFFQSRTEVRSTIADNHLGHVFPDGPQDRGGMRYCLNGVALKFIPKAEMEAAGYGDFLDAV